MLSSGIKKFLIIITILFVLVMGIALPLIALVNEAQPVTQAMQ